MATAVPAAQPDLERSVEKIHLGAEVEETGRGSGPPIVHSQVRRIREEDLRIGDGAGEGLCGGRTPAVVVRLGAGVSGAILCSRPWMLPCSPLGGKAAAM